jgi:hypothetical protein
MKILTILFCLLFALTTYSQNYEYGKPAELKGLTKLFIDTGTNVENHSRIVAELEKSLPKLEILDSMDNSQIVLVFLSGSVSGTIATTTQDYYGTKSTTILPVTRKTGAGLVLIQAKTKDRARLLLSKDYIQKGLFFEKIAIKFAKEFIKAYKKANE